MRSRATIAILVAVLVVGALLLSPLRPAAAQEPSRSEGTERERWREAREEAVQRFAEELGVSVEELDAAFRTVLTEQLDAAVEDGRLTQKRADRIAERVEDAEFGTGFGPRGRHDHPGRGPGGPPWGRWRGRDDGDASGT